MRLLPNWIRKYLNLSRVSSSFSWPWVIREATTGAWQTNVTTDTKETLVSFSTIYSCVTGIASDIAKMRIKLDRDEDGIWTEIKAGSPWLPVLRKPNHYQQRIQFLEYWIVAKLLNGNAYILKQRDNRGIVTGLYVLDPMRVTVLVAEDGGVYYSLQRDFLSQQTEENPTVPASEIIHDRMCCLWHPLIGVSPLYACALAGTMGNKIMNASAGFFGNRAMPGGILTAPGAISNDTAARLKASFETNFTGANSGRLAVLGDGLKFEMIQMTAQQAQLAEQLKWTTSDIARAFHYPEFRLGAPLPPYAGNVEALMTDYYSSCLQILIESLELCLDEGLELPRDMGTELDLDGLMRMDTLGLYEANSKAVGGGWLAPDEARYKANYKPVPGGRSPYLQQQNFSLEALSKRDALADPFDASKPAAPLPVAAPASPPAPPKLLDPEEEELLGYALARKELIA
jgi:HK97 family phage portal protein